MGPAHPENILSAEEREELERRKLRERLDEKQERKAKAIDKKPLKPYRSEAERLAVHQRNIQIGLTATNILLTGLIAAKTFGLI